MSIQDQPGGESQATMPQSAAVEEGTGERKGIKKIHGILVFYSARDF